MQHIIVLTSEPQQQIVPRPFTNQPERRHSNILAMLQNKTQIHFVTMKLNLQNLKSLNVHDSRMLDYFVNCYQSFISNPDSAFSYSTTGVVPYSFARCSVSNEKLHLLDYWKQSGFWGADTFTPIFGDTWDNVLASANNCYCVKDYIEFETRQTIYCLNLYPGHHASYNTYGGYCFVNNGAVCAKTIQIIQSVRSGDPLLCNVAILDLDYHAGDGTANIFKDDPTVTTVSIHADTNLDYPFYSCDVMTDDRNRTKHITFQKDTNISTYLRLLGDAMDFINEKYNIALIIAFGADTYKDDPDASESCRCGLDIHDYFLIGTFIRDAIGNTPIIVTQEGGYDMNNISDIVHEFLSGLNS